MLRKLLLPLGALLLLAFGYIIYLFVTQWETDAVGGKYTIRRNKLTGMVQVERERRWEPSLDNDIYADAAREADIATTRLTNVAWGDAGVLCATANVGPNGLKGRVAFVILVLDTGKKRVRPERVLRASVDWPANSSIPFALNTGQNTPDRNDLKTVLQIQSLYNAENVSATLPAKR